MARASFWRLYLLRGLSPERGVDEARLVPPSASLMVVSEVRTRVSYLSVKKRSTCTYSSPSRHKKRCSSPRPTPHIPCPTPTSAPQLLTPPPQRNAPRQSRRAPPTRVRRRSRRRRRNPPALSPPRPSRPSESHTSRQMTRIPGCSNLAISCISCTREVGLGRGTHDSSAVAAVVQRVILLVRADTEAGTRGAGQTARIFQERRSEEAVRGGCAGVPERAARRVGQAASGEGGRAYELMRSARRRQTRRCSSIARSVMRVRRRELERKVVCGEERVMGELGA